MPVGAIFFRKQTRTYYCKIDGKQVRLCACREEAERMHADYVAAYGCKRPTVSQVVRMFLEHSKARKAKATTARREPVLMKLGAAYEEKLADCLTPSDVQIWLKRVYPDAGPTTQADILTMISTCFRWAERNREVTSKVNKLDKPPRQQREFYLTSDRWPELLGHCKGPMRDIFEFMLFTGARPQEARKLQRRHWQSDRFTLRASEAKGKRRSRVIYVPESLTPRIDELLTDGRDYAFINSKGRPWSKDAINNASRRLKAKLGEPEFCAYTCRHSFAANKVANGEELAIVAQLLGHESVDQVYKRYGHLAKQHDRLLAAVNR